MNNLVRFFIILFPLIGIMFFYNILSEEKFYPGASFETFPVPNFELNSLNSKDIYTLDDLDNELLVNVWASWCITCIIEHEFLMELNRNEFNIVGLNYKDNSEDAIKWLEKYNNPYNFIIFDPKGTLALDMGVTGAPETFLIKDGVVLAHYSGEVNESIWDDVFKPIIKEKKMFQ